MITDNYSKILPDMSMRSMLKNEDLGKPIRDQRLQQEAASERDKELNIYRSGSAPPTVEGSLNSIGGLFDGTEFQFPLIKSSNKGGFLSEEEVRSDPAYVNYYYANVNLNPRLPPPLVSKEDWRFSQRLQGSVGDRRKGNTSSEGNSSLFAVQPGNGNGGGVEWGGDGLIGLPGLDLGRRKKSIAETLQDDMGPIHPISRHPSRPSSRNAFNDDVDNLDSQFDLTSSDALRCKPSATSSNSYASALGASLSRSGTPDPQLVARAPSPRIPPIGGGRVNSMDKRDASASNSFKGISNGSTDLVSALSGLNLDEENLTRFQGQHKSNMNSTFSNYGLNGYPMSPSSPSMVGGQIGNLPPLFENAAASAMGGTLGPNLMAELQNLNRNAGNAPQVPLMDPLYAQYLRSNEYAAAQLAALNEPTMDREYLGNSYMDLLQKAYLGSLLSPQKSHYGAPYPGKTGNLSQNYYGNPPFGLGMPYSGSPVGGPLLPGSPIRHNERSLRFSPGIRNLPGDDNFPSSLLDEFKSNKTRCFELLEIAGHVVEFSADQYGSRFIQQKLETATTEEKNMVFHEIMPHALSLMTDVFGNYVIQKFFEHGSAAQIRELADQLTGHVLTLSLQMYGCRVIQKAIEMVELDQKKKMVMELDGQIMRCVRDQNGNHVIQKCIECVPEDAIQFIVTTFYDQVVTLSTHPYGCRVIQRVLEHCHDDKTQRIMMDEIFLSVLMLAQDQYGNYVVQHVLEHGKPHERSLIIKKLTGQIVQMSQQKFASNVIEKCLTFGTPAERQALVDEMLGTTDENEPLQVMMKDQFANYVVQKVLETCDDQQLELILNRIKVHLNALKKYTYGKHIVARVEKLVAAGERRISILTLQPTV